MSDKDWSSNPTSRGVGGYSIYVTKDAGITLYASRWQTADTLREMAAALLQAADYSDTQEQK
jgi:hypothetical protein